MAASGAGVQSGHILAALDRKIPELVIMQVLRVERTAIRWTRRRIFGSGLDFALYTA